MLSTPNNIYLHMEGYSSNDFSKRFIKSNISINLAFSHELNKSVHISNLITLEIIILIGKFFWNCSRHHVEIILEVARNRQSFWKILFIPSRITFWEFSFLKSTTHNDSEILVSHLFLFLLCHDERRSFWTQTGKCKQCLIPMFNNKGMSTLEETEDNRWNICFLFP